MPIAELSEANIHFERKGSGKTSYVFCHGLGGNGSRFEKEDMDWYAEHFDVISWDNRGLGRSGSAKKYSLPLYANDLKNLLDYLDIEKAIIFGVSWGGVLAQRFATMFPEICLAIVLDSTSSEVNLKASEHLYTRGEIARLGAGGSVILDRTLPKSELHIFQDAGHGVYSTEREGFRKLLLDFLGRLDLI